MVIQGSGLCQWNLETPPSVPPEARPEGSDSSFLEEAVLEVVISLSLAARKWSQAGSPMAGLTLSVVLRVDRTYKLCVSVCWGFYRR